MSRLNRPPQQRGWPARLGAALAVALLSTFGLVAVAAPAQAASQAYPTVTVWNAGVNTDTPGKAVINFDYKLTDDTSSGLFMVSLYGGSQTSDAGWIDSTPNTVTEPGTQHYSNTRSLDPGTYTVRIETKLTGCAPENWQDCYGEVKTVDDIVFTVQAEPTPTSTPTNTPTPEPTGDGDPYAVVPYHVSAILDCAASSPIVNVTFDLDEGYQSSTGRVNVKAVLVDGTVLDRALVSYPGSYHVAIPLTGDGTYNMQFVAGRDLLAGGSVPNSSFTLPTDCANPSAQPTPQTASASLSTSTVTPGSQLTVTGRGYASGESIELWLHSTPVKLATLTASADGTFSRTVTIPEGIEAGTHHIEVRTASGAITSLNLTVVSGLAVTGVSNGAATMGVLLAVPLLGLGLWLMILRRRSSRA